MAASENWSFRVDEEEPLGIIAPPGVPEKVRLALEFLVIPCEFCAEDAKDYLREWRRMADEFVEGYVLSTASAAARRLSSDEVELDPMYRQFEVCRMKVSDFEKMFEDLIVYLEAEGCETGSPAGSSDRTADQPLMTSGECGDPVCADLHASEYPRYLGEREHHMQAFFFRVIDYYAI